MKPAELARADNPDHIELFSCKKLSKLAEVIQTKTQAPFQLGLSCALSTFSTLCQQLIDVEMIEGENSPVNLYIFIEAASGEGKSTVLNYIQSPIMEFEASLASKHEEECQEFFAGKEIYKIKEKALRKEIRRCISSGETEALKNLRDQLVSTNKTLKEPQLKKLIVEDITPEALSHALANGSGGLTLSSSEGNTILNGRVSKDLSFLNKAWGAEQYCVDRKSSTSYMLLDYRLTVLISAQPSVISVFLKNKGELAIDSGLMARFLVFQPVSTQGTRRRNSFKIEDQKAYTDYLKLAESLLQKEHSSHLLGKTDRYTVKFSPEARVDWLKLCIEVEEELKAGGAFEYARGHGSKIPEQIARVAAILTYIEYGESKDISREILYDAVTIVRYSSDTYLRLFQAYPDYIKDAQLLDSYFQTLKDAGERYVKKNRVLQSGPSRLRDKSRLNRALGVLQEKYLVNIVHTQNGLVVLDLLPHLAPCDMAWNCFVRKYGISIASPPGV